MAVTPRTYEKQKPVSLKQKRKQDALELAELVYDMFTRPDKIREEQKDKKCQNKS